MEKRILFVDDEKIVLRVLEALARTHGYAPRSTTDGNEALQIMERDQVRVFLLDLRMPTMDGVELCRQIKQRDPRACVFALSAYLDAYRPNYLLEHGFDGVFPKPFEVRLLLEAFRKAFQKLEQPDAPTPKADRAGA